jgi:hypothetical protein
MIVLTVIAVALVVIAVRPLLPSVLEGIAPDSALAHGWRIVDVEGKSPEFPKVKGPHPLAAGRSKSTAVVLPPLMTAPTRSPAAGM